jgi:hypothetical protein
MADENRKILAASFATLDGGSRGAGSVGGAFPEKVGNTAVLHVKPDGKVKFVETRDWGAGRGALVGGVIGIIGGPIGMLAGGSVFKNPQLEELGKSLGPNGSAVVIDIAADAIPTAQELLQTLGAKQVVVEEVDSSVASLFEGEAAPQPEAD